MLSGFFLIITMGHIYCAILVLALSFLMYQEIISLKRKEEKDKKNLFSWIDWYYFASFAFLMLPNLFVRRVLVEGAIPTGTFLHLILYDYHKLISFGLFVFGILLFVWSLERGSYRYQFQRFAWSMLALILVFAVPTFISYNVYKGVYWFVFPQLCVITNDIMAYFFGICIGKTPLIKLSPKKTWEGFIGGMLSTYVIAFMVSDSLRLTILFYS
jgi:phosphatidate cytidylyltransferase